MKLGGQERILGEKTSELVERILGKGGEKTPWSTEQQLCWGAFWSDLDKKPDTDARDTIMKRAHSKDYHDFESQFCFPKVELVGNLRQAGYNDMINKLLHGDYDF